jgi:polar amino acid transport system substrate-binding protein
MSRFIRVFSIFVLIIFFITGCVQKPQDDLIVPTKAVEDYSNSHKIYLVTEEYPPYGYLENKEIKGIAVDVVKELCKRQNIELKLELLPWTRALKMTELGEADGIFTTFYSEERTKYLDFVEEPLAYEAQYIYTLKGNTINYDGTMKSLSTYKIGILQDYYLGNEFDSAMQNGTLKVEETTDMKTNLQKLVDGRIDLIVDHHLSTLFYLKKMNLLDQVVESKETFRQPESLHLCFSKAKKFDAEFIKQMNDTLKQMKEDGTYDKIVNSYIQ